MLLEPQLVRGMFGSEAGRCFLVQLMVIFRFLFLNFLKSWGLMSFEVLSLLNSDKGAN